MLLHIYILQNIYVIEKDYNSAVQILGAGVEFAFMAGAYYTRMPFWLSKAMLFLLERKFADANPILHQTGPMIEAWVQQNSHHQKESVAKQQKEYLQIFFLVLQVINKTIEYFSCIFIIPCTYVEYFKAY